MVSGLFFEAAIFIYIFQVLRRVSTAVAAVPESASSAEGSAVQTGLQAARSILYSEVQYETKSYYVTLRQSEISRFYWCGFSIFIYGKIHLKTIPRTEGVASRFVVTCSLERVVNLSACTANTVYCTVFPGFNRRMYKKCRRIAL